MLSLSTVAATSIIQDYKSAQSINSYYSVIAEFNMNAYCRLKDFGVLKTSDNSRISGPYDYDKYQLDDGTYQYLINTLRIKYSTLESVFSPQRPDIGILRPIVSTLKSSIVKDSADIKIKQSASGTQETDILIYPYSENSKLDYWSSYRNDSSGNFVGKSASDLTITDSNPYVEYKDLFYANKITINVQNYYSVPLTGSIYVGDSNTPVYYFNVNNKANSPFKDGKFNIYYNYVTQSWTTTQSSSTVVTNFNINAANKHFVSASYVAFKVSKMDSSYYDLQVVEISPRLICDISSYVTSFSETSQISDSSYGLPIGNIANSVGTISLSDADDIFSSNSTVSALKNFLKPNVKFTISQIIKKTVDNIEYTESVPIRVMYSNSWSPTKEKSVDVELEDYMKFFKELPSPDTLFAVRGGIKVDEAIKRLVENVGFSRKNIIVKTASTNAISTLKYFYSRKENTVAQTLEQIAISSQYSIFFDANNKLNILTKERIGNSSASTSASWWFFADPEKANSTDDPSEYDIIQNEQWKSNIISFSEDRVEPLTDIRVAYTGINIPKSPYTVVDSTELQDLSENINFGAPILSRDLRYTNRVLWQAEKDSDDFNGYLMAGILSSDIPDASAYSFNETSASLYRADILKTFQPKVMATSPNDAVRKYFNAISTSQTASPNINAIQIELEPGSMQIYTSAKAYSGYFSVDGEIIRYNGMLFEKTPFGGKTTKEIYFSYDEYIDAYNSLPSKSNLIPKALILYLNFQKTEDDISNIYANGETAEYKLISHGRGSICYGQTKTQIAYHNGIRNSNNIDLKKKMFNLRVFASKMNNGVNQTPEVSMAQKIIVKQTPTNEPGALSSFENIYTYPGYLKISGYKSSRNNVPQAPDIAKETSSLQFYTDIDLNLYGALYDFSAQGSFYSPQYISTRVRIVDKGVNNDTLQTSAGGGIFFGLRGLTKSTKKLYDTFGASYNASVYLGSSATTGYFLEVDDFGRVEDLLDENTNKGPTNFNLYKISYSSGSLVATKLNGNTKRVGVVSAPSEYTTAQILSTEPDNFVNTSDIEIFLSKSANTATIKVFWQSSKIIEVSGTITSTFGDFSGYSGMFVKGDSTALFDHFLIASSPNQTSLYEQIKSSRSKILSNSVTLKDNRVIPSTPALSLAIENKWKYIYEDFGNSVKEVKKIDARFKSPSLKSRIIDISSDIFDYSIYNYNDNAFGADFWIQNNTSDIVLVAENAVFPLMVTGIPLLVGEGDRGTVTLKDLIGSMENEKIAGDEVDVTNFQSKISNLKRLYGEKTIDVAGEYIISRNNAIDIAEWIIKKSMQEKRTFSLEIYPNPLLELGDIVRVFYKTNGYTKKMFGDKSFIISSITYEINLDGPKMNISLRECD